MVASVLLILLALVWNSFDKLQLASAQVDLIEDVNTVANYPTCDDCFCIKEVDQACPGKNPTVGYTAVDRKGEQAGAANEFRKKDVVTPIILGCNPFTNRLCDTQPPRKFRYDLDPVGNAKAVCGIVYELPSRKGRCSTKYELVSYPSWEAAEAVGAIVTHTGPCGVCSSTKDLSVMMTTRDFSDILVTCALKFGIFGFNVKNVIECAEEIEISQDCLKMLVWGSRRTTEDCADVCTDNIANVDIQGPAPECKLTDCSQCGADKHGDFIRSFVGRDPSNSGILAGIVQPCSSYVNLTHYSCPDFENFKVKPNISLLYPAPARRDETSGNIRNEKLHQQLSMISLGSLTVLLSWIIL